MKKIIIGLIALVVILFAVISFRGMLMQSSQKTSTPQYKFVENLNGIGCLKIGMTTSEAHKALDSLYLSHKRDVYYYIDRDEVLKLAKPLFEDEAPVEYHPNHKKYDATLILSKDLVVESIDLYFWADTLYRIVIPNSLSKTKTIGDGLVFKYGEGLGHNQQNGIYENQLHKWGNDRCLVTYIGRTEESDRGPTFFYNIEVITSDSELEYTVKKYLDKADSLWVADRNAKLYKDL